jgi:hypothetical protein
MRDLKPCGEKWSKQMKSALVLLASAILLSFLGVQLTLSTEALNPTPSYVGTKLVRPEGYREWVYLSSGLGMSYNQSLGGPEMFTNVFVPQWAYHAFLSSGKWPDKTVFVLEERTSESKGSINKSGHFQTDLAGLGVQVKDEKRFPEKWAYFNFRGDSKAEEALPVAQCWQCHNDNAAVDHTFVQFFPTLKPVAEKFGTYRKEVENLTTKPATGDGVK